VVTAGDGLLLSTFRGFADEKIVIRDKKKIF